jgi:hypothetical protein
MPHTHKHIQPGEVARERLLHTLIRASLTNQKKPGNYWLKHKVVLCADYRYRQQ